MYVKYGVLTREEVHAKYDIKLEAYVKTKEIELKLLKELALTYVLPTLARQVSSYGKAASRIDDAAKGAGKALRSKVAELGKLAAELGEGVACVDETLEACEEEKALPKKAKLLATKGVEALSSLRCAAPATGPRSSWTTAPGRYPSTARCCSCSNRASRQRKPPPAQRPEGACPSGAARRPWPVAKPEGRCYTDDVERIKRVATVIDPLRWPDSAAEDLLYWITRPPDERVQFGRELVETSYRRVHGGRFPRMSKTGRIFEPEA